jgi:iron complex outermembrane receptor protein
MRNLRKFALVGVSAVALSTPVFAQDVAPADAAVESTEEYQGEEIIVSARRRDESLQEVPATINAVTSEQVQKLNLRDFTEVQTVVPGLQLRTEANGSSASGQVRGITFDPNTQAQPSVAFYYNDAPIGAGQLLQAMYDIGRIEVQRGPQGTLRGIASPSGSIVVFTKKPDLEEIGGNISMTANDIGTLNFNGGFGLPLIEGVAAIRVAGVWDENEGTRVRTIQTTGDNRDPFARTKSGRVSLVVKPTDWLNLEATYQRLDRTSRSYDQYETYPGLTPARPISAGDRLSILETPRLVDQKYNIYNWRAEISLAGQLLIYQGQKSDQVINSRTNSDVANAIVGGDFYSTQIVSQENWSHEIRLQNEERIFGVFDYVLGYFRQESQARVTLLRDSASATVAGNVVTSVPVITSRTIDVVANDDTVENSYFGNLTAHIGEKTEISAGLRYIDNKNPGGLQYVTGATTSTIAARKDSGWIYTASIKHNFTPDLMVYALTGSSRRAGPFIFNANVSPDATEQFLQQPPAETSKSYEIGFKASLFDRRLRLNGAAFHQTFENYLYRPSAGVYARSYPVPGFAQVALTSFTVPVPVEVNGLEGEASFDITPRWNVNLQAAYALAKIKNGSLACLDLNGDGVPELPTTPPAGSAFPTGVNTFLCSGTNQRATLGAPFTATLTTEGSIPLSDKVDLFGRGLVSYYGKAQGDPQFDLDQVGDYALVNLYAGIRDGRGKWEVSLFAKNVFGVDKTLTRNPQAATPISTSPISSAQVTAPYSVITSTAPREFGLNVRFAFGSR